MKRKRSGPPLAATKTTVPNTPEPNTIERLRYCRENIGYILASRIRRCEAEKAKFMESAGKDLLYALGWCESVILSEYEYRELRSMDAYFKKHIDVDGVATVLQVLREEQANQLNRLLESPFRHNSTSAMSNFHQECELRAKADFWRATGFSKGTAFEVIRELERWLAAEAEVLADYPELPEVIDGWRD